MKTQLYHLIVGIKDFFETNFNATLSATATALDISAVQDVQSFVNGVEDVFSLRKYNGMLFIPDKLDGYDREDGTYSVTLDLITAVQASKPEVVQDNQAVYTTALDAFITANPTIGGLCFDAEIESIDFFAPVPGASLIGLLITKLTLTVDGRAI